MSDIAIRTENVGKRYRIGEYHRSYNTLRETVVNTFCLPFRHLFRNPQSKICTPKSEFIWALKDISFEVKTGEVVGIIGRNGAGKTTLLKILSCITEPTEGWAEIRGRVGSLLEVGTGFHPELTGRENIYLNGAIIGMKRVELDRKFDEIVAFSGVESFIDTPLKRYSSGMYVRLAFAVAAHLEPEILLVDEVLAVGDVAFQKKCLGKMGDVAKEGRTVLFVSHNMAAITGLCERAILLENGQKNVEGSVQEVVSRYGMLLEQTCQGDLGSVKDRKGSGAIRMTDIRWVDLDGNELSVLQTGQALALEIAYKAERPIKNPSFLVGVYDLLNRRVFFLDNSESGGLPGTLPKEGCVSCIIDKLSLPPGAYRTNLAVLTGGELADHITDADRIQVIGGDFFGTGILRSHTRACLLMHRWKSTDSTLGAYGGKENCGP